MWREEYKNFLGASGQVKNNTPAGIKTKIFIAKGIDIHGPVYDYTSTVFVDSKTKVAIKCKKHGEFLQLPSNHLKGSGCSKCAASTRGALLRKSTETFIAQSKLIHGDLYNYDKVVYINDSTKVTLVCDKHGNFQKSPSHHLRGQGCPTCQGLNKVGYTYKDFLQAATAIHNDTYEYLGNYLSAHRKIEIRCKKHGVFLQTPAAHIHQAQGCPKCSVSSQNIVYLIEYYKTGGNLLGVKVGVTNNFENRLVRLSRAAPDFLLKPVITWHTDNPRLIESKVLNKFPKVKIATYFEGSTEILAVSANILSSFITEALNAGQ